MQTQTEAYDYRKGIRQIIRLRNERDRLKKRLEEEEEAMKKYMNWAGYETLEVGSHKAVLLRVVARTIDTVTLREEYPELAEDLTISKTYDRLTVR